MAEKTPLIANRAMTYMTRRLLPDDPFEAKPREAKVLVAVGKARLPSEEAPAAKAAPKERPRARSAAKTPRKPKTQG